MQCCGSYCSTVVSYHHTRVYTPIGSPPTDDSARIWGYRVSAGARPLTSKTVEYNVVPIVGYVYILYVFSPLRLQLEVGQHGQEYAVLCHCSNHPPRVLYFLVGSVIVGWGACGTPPGRALWFGRPCVKDDVGA